MNLLGEIHVAVAIYSVIAGALVLRNRKGTVLHTWLGRSFVAAMAMTDLSSFGLLPKYGITWFHALAIWNALYIALGLYYALRRPSPTWIVHHFYFFSYAYLGVLAAAVARVPLLAGRDVTASALIAIAIVFGVGAVLIERTGKRLRVRYALHASGSVA